MLFPILFFAFTVGVAYTCPTVRQMQPCECVEMYFNRNSSRNPTKVLKISCKNAQVDRVAGALAHVAQSERLVDLKLESIELGNLPRQLLAGLNIVDFTARHCNLSTVDEYAFSDTKDTLNWIVLNHNNLERVPTDSLNKLRSLRYLYLDFNRLEVLHADSFKGIHYLKVLSLQGNRLKFIDEAAFEFGSQFDSVFLHENELTAFPSRGLSRPVIGELSVNDNKIASLQPEDFSNMTATGSLVLLRLSNNRIRHIPPRTYSSLNRLMTLVLDGNAIESLDPLAFEGIGDTLEFLSLSENLLQEVPAESLRSMSVLRELHLDRNRICNFRRDDFGPYGRSIKKLYLRNNSLTFVDPMSLAPLHSLKEMLLKDNQLDTVMYATYEHVLDTLTRFDLTGNPLHCDCKIAWLKDLKRSVLSSYGVKCAWPEDYANLTLDEIRKDSLICRDSAIMPPSTHPCGSSYAAASSSAAIVDMQVSFMYLSLVALTLFWRG